MGLRAADPASMKEFVVAVQQRTAELKATLSGSNNGKPVDLGKRVSLILHITALPRCNDSLHNLHCSHIFV